MTLEQYESLPGGGEATIKTCQHCESDPCYCAPELIYERAREVAEGMRPELAARKSERKRTGKHGFKSVGNVIEDWLEKRKNKKTA